MEVLVHNPSLPAEGGAGRLGVRLPHGGPWVHNSAAVGGRGTGVAVVVRRVANNTEGGVADQ